jgi:Kef-type K+ transport system membrane component KefB
LPPGAAHPGPLNPLTRAHVQSDILQTLGLIIVASAAMVLLARLARVPTLVAYIATGLLLGPVLGLVELDTAMELISHVGIALLLFLVGLELSVDKIRDVGGVAVAAGLGQVVFTAAGGFGLSMLLGFDTMESIFLATALTFSSTVVVVKLLSQKKELDALYGRIAVGIFLVQDLVVIVVLTFLAGLGDPDTLTPGTLARSLGLAFGGMLLLLAGAMLASRWVLPRVFGWVRSHPEVTFVWGLCWCFLLVVAAEAMHLSPEIGAFLAGVALAQLPHAHALRRRVHPLTNFFIAVFFVTLGVQMELGAAQAHWGAAVVLSLFVLIGNPFIFIVIIGRLGYGERTSFLTSVTVAQISEFSFIFAAVGLSAGLIDEAILSLIAVVGLVTIAASAYMILYNHGLYALVRRTGVLRLLGASGPDREEDRSAGMEGHVIVVGMNPLGRMLVNGLNARGETTVAVDSDPGKLEGLPGRTISGNVESFDVLEEAGVDHARLLVSALQIEDVNNLLAYHARRLGLPASIHAFDTSVIDDLRELDVSHLMISKDDGIRRIAGELRAREVL